MTFPLFLLCRQLHDLFLGDAFLMAEAPGYPAVTHDIDPVAHVENFRQYIEMMDTKTPSQEQLIGNLSGGNQQKVMIGRWLATAPKILILDEPTRGVDVGAKSEIYAIRNELVKQGVSIIMIS